MSINNNFISYIFSLLLSLQILSCNNRSLHNTLSGFSATRIKENKEKEENNENIKQVISESLLYCLKDASEGDILHMMNKYIYPGNLSFCRDIYLRDITHSDIISYFNKFSNFKKKELEDKALFIKFISERLSIFFGEIIFKTYLRRLSLYIPQEIVKIIYGYYKNIIFYNYKNYFPTKNIFFKNYQLLDFIKSDKSSYDIEGVGEVDLIKIIIKNGNHRLFAKVFEITSDSLINKFKLRNYPDLLNSGYYNYKILETMILYKEKMGFKDFFIIFNNFSCKNLYSL